MAAVKNAGSFRERSKGYWEGRISLGYNENGKRISRSFYGSSLKEVQEKARTLQEQSAKGVVVSATTLKLGAYLDQWYNEVVKVGTSPTTSERYESLIRLHLKPHLGSVKLQSLTPSHVQQLNSLIKGSAWTRKMAAVVLHNALSNAVKIRLIANNPAADVERAKPVEKELLFLSLEESQQLLAAAKSKRLFAFFALALGSGMRQGELLALQWSDIDWKHGKVKITKSLIQSSFTLKEPKSRNSKRTITVPPFVIEALKEHRKKMEAEEHGSPFCFVTKTGAHIGKSNLTRQVFRPLLKKAGLRQIRIHDLRHSHASTLLNNGCSVKAVSRRLGHSSVELTLRVYAHVLPDADDTLAAKTEELFTHDLPTMAKT